MNERINIDRLERWFGPRSTWPGPTKVEQCRDTVVVYSPTLIDGAALPKRWQSDRPRWFWFLLDLIETKGRRTKIQPCGDYVAVTIGVEQACSPRLRIFGQGSSTTCRLAALIAALDDMTK